MVNKNGKEAAAFEFLSKMIDEVFSTHYTKETDTVQQELQETPKEDPAFPMGYESIEQFVELTGKRYRMLKEQKERGLTREGAFNETYGKEDQSNDS
tara:strand:+ start:70 stop:360 length:291 start_codon:yes stop_codon:yes gene_type:complete